MLLWWTLFVDIQPVLLLSSSLPLSLSLSLSLSPPPLYIIWPHSSSLSLILFPLFPLAETHPLCHPWEISQDEFPRGADLLKVCIGTPKSPEKPARFLLLDYQQLNLQDGNCWITNSFGQRPGSPTEEKCSLVLENIHRGTAYHCHLWLVTTTDLDIAKFTHLTTSTQHFQHKSPNQVQSNWCQAAKQRSDTQREEISFWFVSTNNANNNSSNTSCNALWE